jgi:uncharacterized protein
MPHENLYTENCIRTFSGIYFNLANPNPEDVFAFDIAVALSRECRFNNHTKKVYTVAEHSVWCAALAEQFYPEHSYLPFYCLLHDAHEAYIRDIASPVINSISQAFKDEWNALKDSVQQAIDLRFGVRNSHKHELVKKIDKQALEFEWNTKMLSWKGLPPLGEKAACDLFIHHFIRLCKVPVVLQPSATM